MGQELTIGRGYSNLLRLEGEEISRVHAIIYRRNNDFVFRDLDSKNGVFVNGSRVMTATLGSGDLLQVGKYRLVFNPPAGFDVKAFVNADDNIKVDPYSFKPTIDVGSGEDYSRSQIFSGEITNASVDNGNRHNKPEILREEVLLFTRPELDERIASDGTTAIEKAADYLEDFFNSLLAVDSTSEVESPNFLTDVLRAAVKSISADRGVIVLRDHPTDSLKPGAIVPEKGDVAVNRVVLQSGFGEGKAIICPVTGDCGLFRDSNTVRNDRIASLLSVPLGRTRVSGLLYIDRQGDAEGFNLAHLLTMARVGRLLELHLRN